MLLETPEVELQGRRAVFRMAIVFLLVSFLASLAFLATRNIYDDEIGTTSMLRVPTRQIVAEMNHTDVHPPGMYVLAHLGYQVVPSPRWVTIFPLLCLYGGLAVFVLAVAPLFRDPVSRLCFLLFATLHPQLLMWGNSIRWYPWWTGVALATVAVALQPSRMAVRTLSYARAGAVGGLIACLFYLNYITIVFTMALVGALLLRYGWSALRPLLVTGLVALVLIAPQLKPFLTVHLAGSGEQRSNPVLSLARLVQSLYTSEAFLPWHPVAIVAALVFLLLTGLGFLRLTGFLWRRGLRSLDDRGRSLASLLLLSLLFFVLVAVSGLGGKPRNALALVPLLAPAVGLVAGELRRPLLRWQLAGFLAIWSAWGIAHLLAREGLTKSGMNNRPEEVLHFIAGSRGSDCSLVVTYDPILTFYLVESRLPRLRVLTLSQNTMYTDAVPFAAAACPAIDLYVVESFLGGFGGYETILPAQLGEAAGFIELPVAEHRFSYDPDARIKRRFRFAAGETLPDFRYTVRSGRIEPGQLSALQSRLGYFTVADGRSEPRLQ